jgi:hypothetical protein
VPVALNRLAVEHDHVLICGPVFPHEVAGFSGGTKYLFPGIAGPEIMGSAYGESERRLREMFAAERGDPVLVFNGDFHWFDVADDVFAEIERGVTALGKQSIVKRKKERCILARLAIAADDFVIADSDDHRNQSARAIDHVLAIVLEEHQTGARVAAGWNQDGDRTMKHRVAGRKLGRTSMHRTALLRNLSTELFRHERIRTERLDNAPIRSCRGIGGGPLGDTLLNGTPSQYVLRGIFRDVTYPIPVGATDLAIRFEGNSTFFNEVMAWDNVRITAAGADPPTISISRSGANVVVTFTGVLQSSATVNGTYTDVIGAVSPFAIPPASQGTQQFYRARNP